MPFNIELSKNNGVIIKLQVVKNTLSFYFRGTAMATKMALSNWRHLEKHFINTIPGYNSEWVRGPDDPHVKRNHTNTHEIESMHFHTEFNSEITPELFTSYLNKFFVQQMDHKDERYQFFTNETEITEIINKFGMCYREYKGSSTETLYEEETRLTSKEQSEYEASVIASKDREKLTLPVSLLLELMVSSRHPLFSMPLSSSTQVITPARATLPLPEKDNTGCLVM